MGKKKIKGKVGKYIKEKFGVSSTATIAEWPEDAIVEIEKMFRYILSCEDPQKISYKDYLQSAVVSVVPVVSNQRISIPEDGSVVPPVSVPAAELRTLLQGLRQVGGILHDKFVDRNGSRFIIINHDSCVEVHDVPQKYFNRSLIGEFLYLVVDGNNNFTFISTYIY